MTAGLAPYAPRRGERLRRVRTASWTSNTHYEDPREGRSGVPLCDHEAIDAVARGLKKVRRQPHARTDSPVSCRLCVAVRRGRPLDPIIAEIYGKILRAPRRPR